MTRILWDETGKRLYETGVDHGVLYLLDGAGEYSNGEPWNGLTAVTESPGGAEATPLYADNIKYLNLVSAEDFSGTIEAFTYPVSFELCDGTASPAVGVTVGQQRRRTFGFVYRTLIGNDIEGTDYGYKLHLVYGALAAPSEKSRATVNDTPEAVTFSWEFSTTPVAVPGFKPSATITIDSTQVDPADLAALEDALYGTAGTDPRLPLPAEVFAFFSGAITEVIPVKPTLVDDDLTIPTVTGITYKIDGAVVTGVVVITEDVVVTASPNPGYKFPPTTDDDWLFEAP